MFVMPVIPENVLMSPDGNDGIVHLLLWYRLTLLSLVGGFECAVFFRFFAFRNKGKHVSLFVTHFFHIINVI